MINEYFKTGYNWLQKLTADLLKELRKDKQDIIVALDHKDVTEAIVEANKGITEAVREGMENVVIAVNDKEVVEEVKITNIGELTDKINEVVSTLKEELSKIDKEIVVKNDLSSLTALFKSGADKKDLLKALKSIENKIKSPEITDYTLILDELVSVVEAIKLPEVDLKGVEELLSQISVGVFKEQGNPLDKYAKYDRIKVELSDAQVKKMAANVSVASGGGSNLSGLITTNSHTGNQELRVYQENHICLQNTTSTPLGANATFTGEWQDCLNYQEVNVSIVASHNSASNGLVFQWSADGVTVGDTDVFSYYTASGGTNYTPNPAFRYVRMVYTNGATPQTSFNLMTILRRSATGGSFHRIDSTLKDDSDARLNITVPKLKTAANTYVSQTATTAGNAKMSVEEFDAAVATDTNKLNVAPFLTDENGVQNQMLADTVYTGAPVVIDIDHHEIHCGDSFVATRTVDLGNGAVDTIIIQVPNETGVKKYHLTIDTITELEANFDIYEGATTAADGTAITSYNRDRNSQLASSLAITHTPTTPAAGTLIYTEHWGSGRSSGGESRGQKEFVLKNNTKYRLVMTNSTVNNNYISWKFNYYIHPGI